MIEYSVHTTQSVEYIRKELTVIMKLARIKHIYKNDTQNFKQKCLEKTCNESLQISTKYEEYSKHILRVLVSFHFRTQDMTYVFALLFFISVVLRE